MMLPADIAARLARRSERVGACVVWRGATRYNGYGVIGWTRGTYIVHRVAYETFVGPIPTGHHVHHLCGNRLCIEPTHLATMRQAAHNWLHRRERCWRGHDLAVERRQTPKGLYYCRACGLIRSREQQERRVASATG